jgi:hypothetical protein
MRLRSVAASAAALAISCTSMASAASLYGGTGRPGPDILYAPLAAAPQFVNAGIWRAAPILVSGASSYRSGEYVYQDFLYDDHGAVAPVMDPTDVRTQNATFSRPAGTYTYPTDPHYAENAADLVELRLKPTTGGSSFRVTFNTMIDSSRAAFTIALGGTAGTTFPMPHGANTRAPGTVFLTWHGNTYDIKAAATGTTLYTGTPTVRLANRQVEVFVPNSVYVTTNQTALRVAAATGLWNNATNTYLIPGIARNPADGGGASGLLLPSAFYNVAFRHAEPAQGALKLPYFPANELASTQWRELAQSRALAAGDISQFFDTVNMTKVAAGTNDDMNGSPQGVPLTGSITRILASHFEPAQGANQDNPIEGDLTADPPQYLGNLQPYTIYVPSSHTAGAPYQLTVLLHALDNNYNQFTNTNHQIQFANRGGGTIVLTPEGRSPGSWYYGLSEVDVFEAWADVAAHYPLNPSATSISGYSMGGYGAYKISVEFPDLFNRLAITVGGPYVGLGAIIGRPTVEQPGTQVQPLFGSLRNVPALLWYTAGDELVPPTDSISTQMRFDALNYRYEYDLFNAGDHLVFDENDQYAPQAAFLDTHRTNLNPPHVTFNTDPTTDLPTYADVHDHAYWVSQVRLRTLVPTNPVDGRPVGIVDARSEGFGVGDPPVSPTILGGGVVAGGALGALTYSSFAKTWGPAPAAPVRDVLHINATNVASVTINPVRAKIDCAAVLDVQSDGPISVTLSGCGTKAFAATRAVQRTQTKPGGIRTRPN